MLLIFGFANLLFSQSKDKNEAHLPVFKTASDWIEYSSKFIFQSSKEQNKIPSPSIFDNDINGFNDDLSKLRLNHYTIKTQSNPDRPTISAVNGLPRLSQQPCKVSPFFNRVLSFFIGLRW